MIQKCNYYYYLFDTNKAAQLSTTQNYLHKKTLKLQQQTNEFNQITFYPRYWQINNIFNCEIIQIRYSSIITTVSLRIY